VIFSTISKNTAYSNFVTLLMVLKLSAKKQN